jgi:tyrosine-protein phosphatase YwqE
VFFGNPNRQKSIKDGLVVFLTPDYHNMSNRGVHFNRGFDLYLKEIGQQAWMDHYGKSKEEFIKEYGRNYL